jgi:hypothetical protein
MPLSRVRLVDAIRAKWAVVDAIGAEVDTIQAVVDAIP